MKLKSKNDKPKQFTNEIVYRKALPLDLKIYEYDFDAVLKFGKFAGITLGHIRKHEEWYYCYMLDNDLINNWGLYKEKVKAVNKGAAAFYSETDKAYWISIHEVPVINELTKTN